MKVAVIIPAKKHSSYENKNIRPIFNKPLIQYTLWAAKDSKADCTFVSTDSKDIAEIARTNLCEVIYRPKELCTDEALVEDVLVHSLGSIKDSYGHYPEFFVYMQVTDILRPLGSVNMLINMALTKDIDSAFFSYPTHKHYWDMKDKLVDLNPYPKLSRQKANPIYREDTGIGLICRTSKFLETKSRICGKKGMVVNDDPMSMIDIHTERDLDLAAFVLHSDIAKAKDYKYYHEYSFKERTAWQKT